MICMTLALIAWLPSGNIRLEAEAGTLSGPAIAAEASGYSGTGYVTGFTHGNDWVSWRTPVMPGIYDIKIGYRTPGGVKGFELKIDGRTQSGMFQDTKGAFDSVWAGKVALTSPEVSIAVGKGWGYYDIDYVELIPSKPFPRPKAVSARLNDRQATPEAKALMARLARSYGRTTLSGQYDAKECELVRKLTGKTPAILGGDLMAYSPSRLPFGEKNDGIVEKLVAEGKKGAIVTLSWHWNAPKDLLDRKYKDANGKEIDASWYKGFYTNATTFDVAKALANPGSEDYRLILRDIDAAAVQLRKFQDAKVPVLWRPLHEADGKWFWWGAKGPEPLKKLWRLMYDRLTKTHRLHNLIWVFNSPQAEWYPGDDVVDIMSVDTYPADRTDPLAASWKSLIGRFDGRKMLAVAEFPGSPDVEGMARLGIRWSYFVSWTGDLGPKGTPLDLLKKTYGSKLVENRK